MFCLVSSTINGRSLTSGTPKDRPTYNKSRCFETFPFPDGDTGLIPDLRQRIAALAEQIDAHLNRQQAGHAALTLTGMYNVLEALRGGRQLPAKEKTIHQQGLAAVLKELRDELDAAVLQACGREPGQSTDALLTHLVAMNARRAAEQKTGHIRWLRLEFQNPALATLLPNKELVTLASQALQADLAPDSPSEGVVAATGGIQAAQAWPGALPDRVRSVAQVLANTNTALPQSAIGDRSVLKRQRPVEKKLAPDSRYA